ncbi:MAG: NADH-quinone oxidoreductase subunit A [Planctomycetota bacterium]|nr:NADH-quinone oxidoreductase subunit A [Planctomycetota bacterium]
MSAIESSTSIVAYLTLFVLAGLLFLFVNLLVGYLLRPHNPGPEKGEIYECGEPTIGSSFVQFDLRFYVVALLFIIFDVEIAFFFPWATVFGKANHLHDATQAQQVVIREPDGDLVLNANVTSLYRELGVRAPVVKGDPELARRQIGEQAKLLARATLVDIAVFFAILLIGFAYVWKRGDLDWVRSLQQSRGPPSVT